MSMTREASTWHEKYEALPLCEKRLVDKAYTAARNVLSEDINCAPANDDRAEELVAAITKYYMESQ